jgi:hypothetical protein
MAVSSALGAGLRAGVICLLVLALAACGGSGGPRALNSPWQQPASYDPPGPASDPWGPYIRQASQRFDVPETWIREVMRQESAFRATATSRAGAMGLMQVMPGTYRELQGRYALGTDPYHPWNSVMAGTAYIREMYELYGNPGFLAAYNAGPRRFEDYLWAGRGLPGETRNYVARIGPRIAGVAPARRAPPEIYAAAEVPTIIPAGPRPGNRATMLALRDQRTPPPSVREGEPPIQVASLPRGPVYGMEPIEDGRPVAPTALAGRMTMVPPAPGAVPVAPEGARFAGLPEGARFAGLPEGARVAAPAEPAGIAVAALPPPPGAREATGLRAGPEALARDRGLILGAARAGTLPPPAPGFGAASRPGSLPPPSRAAPAARPAAQPEPVLAAAPRRLSLVGTAQAGTLARPATPARGAPGGPWSVQVGAFASENLARAAASQARERVALLGARPVVVPVRQGRETLYRARVTGLSREAAMSACQRIGSGRNGCIVVSPDA